MTPLAVKPSIDDVVAADVAAHGDLPAVPDIDTSNADLASVEYSQHRTKLSTHRTALSERRTGMSTERTEMSSRRTGMSFQRTRMSADRTLMSVIRTALSLISFGFTIYQFFQHLAEKNVLSGGSHAARNFGMTLIYLGVGMVAVGIAYHLQFMVGLRREREEMMREGLVHAQSRFPISFTLLIALALLFLGIAAIASLTFHVGPFG
jgi:inner membrane protein YidH